MKEHEIVAKFLNTCAGSSRLQRFFKEAELGSTDDYIRMKHGGDLVQFIKEVRPNGQTVHTYDNGSVASIYEFTEL